MTEVIKGAKGGSKPRTPREAPDSLVSIAYARLLDLISEGEIEGLVDGASSIYLDETPAGSGAFPGFRWEQRTGTQDQDYLQGFSQVENEVGLGVELRSDAPWVRSITNLDLSAVRINFSLPRLTSQNVKNGDTNGFRIEYAIDVAAGVGPFEEVLKGAFDGKTNGGYERSVRVDLEGRPTGGWRVRVRRLTPNSTSSAISDTTNLKSITEIIDAKFRYPNSALVGVSFDAETFGGSVPKRGYHMRGRIIRVPSNYDHATRTYTGIWDGTFKPAYSNNPAWVYYDLLLHHRYGLGDRVDASQVDKWSLYQIAQYCDQLVSDGMGGMEPRFTCNLYLQKQVDAYKALQDIAAIFRGITYWGAGQAVVSADMPADPVYTYTNGNVIGGKFNYKGSKRSTRYSAVLVSWNDPTDMYRAKVEYVQDDDAVARFGVQKADIMALGCTSQGQAQRAGKWALLTNLLETETVSFSVGLDGIRARPGQIIRVADNDRAGRRIGGRVSSATRNIITVDKIDGAHIGDELTCILPTGEAQLRNITGIDGNQITVSPQFDAAPVAHSVWAWESQTLAAQRYRIVSISESGPLEYAITASKYVEGKHQAVDTGAIISQRPITSIPASVQVVPENIRAISTTMLEQTMAVTTMTIIWDAAEGATRYDVEWRRGDGAWVYAGRTGGTELDVEGIYAGTYQIRVRAMNSLDIASPWAYSDSIELQGKQGMPPAPAYIDATSIIFGIELRWGFPEGAEDTLRTEIEYNTQPSEQNAMHLGDYAYPADSHTMTGLKAAQVFYFRARLVDRTGNIGPWSDWVMGQSSADADEILDYIAGQITETELGQHLREEIELISGDGPGSVNERIGDVVGQVDADLTGINGRVDDLRDDLQANVDGLNDAISAAEDRLSVDIGAVSARTDTLDQSVAGLQAAVSDLDGDLQSSVSDLGAAIEDVDSRLTGRIENVASDIAGLGTSISDLYGQVAGLDDDLQGSVSDLNSQLAQLETQIADITGAEDWSAEQAYLAGTLARFDGALYRAEQDVPAGTPVTNEAYWRKVGDYSSLGEAVASLAVQVSDMQTRVADIDGTLTAQVQKTDSLIAAVRPSRADGEKADSLRGWQTQASITQRDRVEASDKAALAERLLVIDAQIGDASAQLSSLEQAFASETEAAAGRLDQLAVDLGTTTAGLQQEIQTRATETSALASDVQSIQAALGDVATVEAFDALAVRVDQMGDDITGVAQSVTDLTSRIADTESGLGVVSQAVEGLETSVGLIEGELSAQAGQLTALGVSIGEVGDLAEQADGKADDALLGLGDKADASAVQGLTVEVQQMGEDIAANSGLITQLESSVQTAQGAADDALAAVATKADASAVQALTIKVEQIGDTTAANSGLITQLESSVSTAQQAADAAQGTADDALAGLGDKADSSALQSLTTEVEQVGADVSANAGAITDLGSRIETAETGIVGNADAVEALTTEVAEIDGKVTAAAEQASRLSASLRPERADGEKADSLRGWKSQASIVESSRVSASEREALAQRLFSAEVQLGDAAAQLSVLETAFADESEATASQLTALASELGTTASGLQQEIQTRATETAALASDVQAMQAELEGVATSEALQALTVEVEQLGGDITSVAQSVTSLTGRIESTETGLQGVSDAVSGLQTSVSDIEGELSAQASDITDLGVSIGQAADLAEQADGKADDALLGLGDKADATAVQGLTVEVQQLGEDVSANSGSITELNSSVEAAQQAADDALAGLTDKADASAVQALTTEVEQIGEDLSAASQSITDLDASLQVVGTTAQGAADLAAQADGKADDALLGLSDKADSSAVQALTVEVNQIGEDLSAASQSITDLGSSLSTVSDVADGAAQAADDALAGLLTKADASAVQSLTTDVAQIGEDVTANSGAITQLGGRLESAETGIAGNADAVESLTTDVELIDGKVTAAAEQASRLSAELRPERADGEKADSLRGWKSQASITESSRVSASEREVLAERLFAAEVQMGEANAQLTILEQAFADENEATASQLTNLASEIGTTSSALSQEVSTRATETAALAQDVQALQAALGDAASADALAALVTEVEDLEGRVTASAQDIVSLSASLAQAIDDIASKADSSALQALEATVTQQGDQITATAQSVTDLQATVDDEISAAVQSLQQAVADESAARASDISTVTATASAAQQAADDAQDDADLALQGVADNSAAVQQANQAIADEASARASAIQTVQASVSAAQDTADQAAQEAGQATAAVQTVSQAVADLDGDLSAMWSVKMQVNQNGEYVYAGVGLGIENGPGGLQSQFLVEANRFALLNTLDGLTTVPFVVEGGQVFMSSAVIKQADIVNLIVTGVLQSGNYVAGQSGIRLNFISGEFEMNATVPGQGRTVMTNRAIKVYDAQNPPRLRVQLGDLNA